MKKYIFIIFMALTLPYMCLAQSKPKSQVATVRKAAEVAKIDSLLQECRELRKDIFVYSSTKSRYKLYPTENIYTFLKLNTETGQIWQLQWSMEEEREGEVIINASNLKYSFDSGGTGSFELYPTKNMYTFILIEKDYGRKWHVQWGMDTKYRFIRQIF